MLVKAARMLADIINFVSRVLQDELHLEVSAKKSKVVASRRTAAVAATASMRTQKVSAASHAKLLGAGAVGRKRRSTIVIHVHLRQLTQTIGRYLTMRAASVSTKQMV